MNKEMTINQALRRCKVLKGNIKDWMERAIASNVQLDTNKSPTSPYKTAACLVSLGEATNELIELETRIAMTNASVLVKSGEKSIPLAYAVRVLSNLKSEINFLKSIPSLVAKEVKTTETKTGYNRKTAEYTEAEVEITQTCQYDKLELQSLIDLKQQDFDDLNGVVEAANHLNGLVKLPG